MQAARSCFIAALVTMFAVVPSAARAVGSRGSGVTPTAPPRTALRVRSMAAYLRDLTALVHRATPAAGPALLGQVELVTTTFIRQHVRRDALFMERAWTDPVTGARREDDITADGAVVRSTLVAGKSVEFINVAGFHGSH